MSGKQQGWERHAGSATPRCRRLAAAAAAMQPLAFRSDRSAPLQQGGLPMSAPGGTAAVPAGGRPLGGDAGYKRLVGAAAPRPCRLLALARAAPAARHAGEICRPFSSLNPCRTPNCPQVRLLGRAFYAGECPPREQEEEVPAGQRTVRRDKVRAGQAAALLPPAAASPSALTRCSTGGSWQPPCIPGCCPHAGWSHAWLMFAAALLPPLPPNSALTHMPHPPSIPPC